MPGTPALSASARWRDLRQLAGHSGRPLAIVAVIAIGLLLDSQWPHHGQRVTNVLVWATYLIFLWRESPAGRAALIFCLLYATAGEVFLSLVWGLYDYRLGNIPLFVPPGHALLFLLGLWLSERARAWLVPLVVGAAVSYAVAAFLLGFDSLAAPLVGLLAVCVLFSPARRLYAVMFLAALALELAGTAVGCWTWQASVPWLGLTTTNPPLSAGAFYCVLDLLIVGSVALLGLRRATPPDAQPDASRIARA